MFLSPIIPEVFEAFGATVLVFVGEYEIGEHMEDINLDYMGRNKDTICLYDPYNDKYLFAPITSNNIYVVRKNGIVYEFHPSSQSRVQVYRRS